jgi:hypothetical protein
MSTFDFSEQVEYIRLANKYKAYLSIQVKYLQHTFTIFVKCYFLNGGCARSHYIKMMHTSFFIDIIHQGP